MYSLPDFFFIYIYVDWGSPLVLKDIYHVLYSSNLHNVILPNSASYVVYVQSLSRQYPWISETQLSVHPIVDCGSAQSWL